MDRRTFLAGTGAVLLAAPLTVEAQPPVGKVYRIGMLETRSSNLNAANLEAFRQGLLELGYKEGQNLEIVYRSSDGHDERFPELASELVRLNVDLIVTRGRRRPWRHRARPEPFRSSWRPVPTPSERASSPASGTQAGMSRG